MGDIVFIGDEIGAAGYRLAGARVFSPPSSDVFNVFETACASADVVLITADAARHMPVPQLHAAQASKSPLIVVIDDIRNRVSAPNLEDYVRNILGLDG